MGKTSKSTIDNERQISPIQKKETMNKQKERARKNTCVNKNGKHSHEVRFMLSRIARREEKEEREQRTDGRQT